MTYIRWIKVVNKWLNIPVLELFKSKFGCQVVDFSFFWLFFPFFDIKFHRSLAAENVPRCSTYVKINLLFYF